MKIYKDSKGKMKQCAYCRKRIGNNAVYERLGSGLLLHHTKADCSRKAFQEKNLRARWFRIKNAFLYNLFKWNFFLYYIKFMKKEDKRKKIEDNKNEYL